MAELALLTSNKNQAVEDARAILAEAMERGFEAVVVVGIKGHQAHTCKSKSLDTLSLVGAVELAKHTILANWKETA